MTYASLIDLLKQMHPMTYPYSTRLRPKPRYIVYERYGAGSHYGDDANILDFPRVQLDIYTQTPEDLLPAQVCQLLQSFGIPYEVVDEGYDDDLALFRKILQLEVMG